MVSIGQFLPYVFGFLIGVLTAGVVLFLALRKVRENAESRGRTDGRVEMARLQERSASLDAELTQNRSRLKQCDARLIELQTQLDAVRDERARLDERTRRVPVLESELATAQSGLDVLQSRIEEEGKRAAAFAEQSSRVPQLEETLRSRETELERLNGNIAEIREKLGAAVSSAEELQTRNRGLEVELTETRKVHQELLEQQEDLKVRLTEATAELEAERTQTVEKLALLNEAKDQLADHFKSLANDILEEKTRRFTDQNKENMGQILEPLRTKLQEFQGKVEEVYVQEGKDRSALAEQVRQLMSLNQQLSADAHSLTQALKGSSNTRGSWGELILERVLESSGLRKGQEYDVKESVKREDGSRGQPDVVIHLPESKELVIDAKVSLVAYEEYTKAETDRAREIALARHIDAVRTHIKELSEKNYQNLYGLKSLDCVIMFLPVEPAFILAVSTDTKLWEYAWRKNVLLVCPSTLLFVLRTVAHIWHQEQQNRNVQEIAKRGGELYDKFTGFLEELHKLGERLKQAQDCYDGAIGKFEKGRGNLIRQAEMLRELGVKPSKCLPEELVDAAFEDSPETPSALPENSDLPVAG
jgi:DNA recombination protein RmuC